MDHRHVGRLGFVLFAFFAVGAVSIVPGTTSAQHCADPASGWRGCDHVDTDTMSACFNELRANFYSQEEVEDYLIELDTNHDPGDHLALIPIGESVVQGVFGLGPAIPSETFPVVVARVAEDATDPEIDKPAILLVADVHPQEWIGSEVALGYIDYLVQGINSGDTDVTSLLEEVEVWVVVVANAAGRWWDDLSSYEPLLGTCGPNCQGDDVSCCVDENGVYECRNVRGSDEENCGGCDKACEWDEICLNGVCATGEGTSCWNTQCSEGTTCVSDSWFWQTDPKCKAVLVDSDYCGLWGDTCAYDEMCTAGLCSPKVLMSCDQGCSEGESCCWIAGTEDCVDTDTGNFNCGGCGNVCPVGTTCHNGLCVDWYTVFDVCIGDLENCGDGTIDCVDIETDEENCGGCGVKCGDYSWCENGLCYTEVNDVVIDD